MLPFVYTRTPQQIRSQALQRDRTFLLGLGCGMQQQLITNNVAAANACQRANY
jgi:hypothetical protein